MRRPYLFGLLTAAHFAATVGLLLFVFGSGMSRFDSGGQPGWFEAACGRLLSALGFPLLTLVEGKMAQRFPGLWGYVPFVANSALWAAACLGVLGVVKSVRTRPRHGYGEPRTRTTRRRYADMQANQLTRRARLMVILVAFLVSGGFVFVRVCADGGAMASAYRTCECRGLEWQLYDRTAADGPRRTLCIGYLQSRTCHQFRTGPIVPCPGR